MTKKRLGKSNGKIFLEVMDIITFSALVGISSIIATIGFRVLSVIDELYLYTIIALLFFLSFLLKYSFSSNKDNYFPVFFGRNYKTITIIVFPLILSATLATYTVTLLSRRAQIKMMVLINIFEKQFNQAKTETLILLPVFIGAFIFAAIVATQFKKYFSKSKSKYIYLLSFFGIEMVFLIASTVVLNTIHTLNFEKFIAKALTATVIGAIPLLSVKYLFKGGKEKTLTQKELELHRKERKNLLEEEHQLRIVESQWDKN